MQDGRFCLPPKKLEADVLRPSIATTIFQTSASTAIIAASDEAEEGLFRFFLLY